MEKYREAGPDLLDATIGRNGTGQTALEEFLSHFGTGVASTPSAANFRTSAGLEHLVLGFAAEQPGDRVATRSLPGPALGAGTGRLPGRPDRARTIRWQPPFSPPVTPPPGRFIHQSLRRGSA